MRFLGDVLVQIRCQFEGVSDGTVGDVEPTPGMNILRGGSFLNQHSYYHASLTYCLTDFE